MRAKFRKLIGASVITAYLPVYAILAMAIAQIRPLREAPGAVQALCFAGLGIGWILPLFPLIRWMEKPDFRG
ncbi:MAG: DUF2842 domain-containing protein [Beijerinckiaceae bacterium]|nr:DUF2842 domain-containing protein [Beijerinckiaceae bacterium]